MFHSVCLQLPGDQAGVLKAVLWSSSLPEHVSLLQHYLGMYFQGRHNVTCRAASAEDAHDQSFEVEQSPTVLWVINPSNQESLGHALVNEVRHFTVRPQQGCVTLLTQV